MHVYLIKNDEDFPAPELANTEPNGLLATGGDLSANRLIKAYSKGIFPWFSQGEPILWWSPDPRSVLFPDKLRVSRSLRKILRQNRFTVSLDQNFDQVIRACAAPRGDHEGTWITGEMIDAYQQLFSMGIAHSVEAWLDGELVGGLYGVAMGKVFFGESMFSREDNASKVAFAWLVKQLQVWDYQLIDCQIQSAHLDSLGAQSIPRAHFQMLLRKYCTLSNDPRESSHTHWNLELANDYWLSR